MRLPPARQVGLVLLLIALPLIVGTLEAVLLESVARPVPVLVFKVGLSVIAFGAGLALSGMVAAFYAGAVFRERQAQRRVDAALLEAERSRNRFLRRLDHEIKNPLTGLQVALANLRESSS